MKTKFLFIALAAVGLMFQGCDDDDNIKVDPTISTAFYAKYPEATKVSWEKKKSYYVADFRRVDLSANAEAWYDGMAVWYMTETDIRYDALPEAIKTSFKASEYAEWRVDDVDMLERKDMETVYVLEVEKGKQEYDLFYSVDGVLIKAVPDTDNDSWDYLP